MTAESFVLHRHAAGRGRGRLFVLPLSSPPPPRSWWLGLLTSVRPRSDSTLDRGAGAEHRLPGGQNPDHPAHGPLPRPDAGGMRFVRRSDPRVLPNGAWT